MNPFKNCKIAGIGVDSAKYHADKGKRGDPAFIMSPSSLKAFADNGKRWIDGYDPPQTEAKDLGNLIDVLFLTPELAGERLALQPEKYPHQEAKSKPIEMKDWHNGSTWCKQWVKDHQHLQIVSPKQMADARAAVTKLESDPTIAYFIDCSDTQVHVTGEYHDAATGLIIPVQCLIDAVPDKASEYALAIGDLKRTRSAHKQAFKKFMFQNGYHVQAAFDIALYNAATGESRLNWHFMLSESFAPWATGRRILRPDTLSPEQDETMLGLGRASFLRSLRKYAKCLKTNVWDEYDEPEEWSEITPEPYMVFSETEKMMESNYQQALDESAEEESDDVIP